MSQFFETFLTGLTATPYVNPDSLPDQPDILDLYRTQINISGDITANGTTDALVATINPTGVVPGKYNTVVVNAKGQVISGSDSAVDTSWVDLVGKPTTLAGFGITDAYTQAQVDVMIADVIASTAIPFVAKTFSFPVPALVWQVKHNMYTKNFLRNMLDVAGNEVFANITIVDNTEFLVEFTEAIAGSIDVVFILNS